MCFAIRDLSVLAYAQGFTLWHYKARSEMLGLSAEPGFFDAASDMLEAGDMVLVSGPTGGRMLCVAESKARVVTAPLM